MPSLLEEFSQAREHVVQAQKRIEDQIILVDRLKADGHDTEMAERLLATFIDLMMTQLTLHRDQLNARRNIALKIQTDALAVISLWLALDLPLNGGWHAAFALTPESLRVRSASI